MATKKKTSKKAAPGFKPSAGTQAKMRKLREAYDALDILAKQVNKLEEKARMLEEELAHVISIRSGQWREFEKYVKKNDCFDLYQRRLSSTACIERFGDKLPKFLEHHSIPVLKHRRRN